MASPSHTNDELIETLRQILVNQQTFQHDLTILATEVHQLRTRFGPPGFPPPFDPPPPQPFAPTTIKLDIPRFDGKDPLSWIFKINQFFEFHRTPEDQRLRLASFYMEGEALTWFEWMHANGQLISWTMFIQALEL